MSDPQAKKLKKEIAKSYKNNIQQPLQLHRYDMAGKFKTRIDYVDISAYGIGDGKPRTDDKGMTILSSEVEEPIDEQEISYQKEKEK